LWCVSNSSCELAVVEAVLPSSPLAVVEPVLLSSPLAGMRARAADGKSERESIMAEAPDDARKSLRDGAMPCCVLTLLLVVAAGLGAAAVWLSLAAFDPEHSTSSLVLLSKPVPSAAHNAATTATRGSSNTSGGFRFEAASIDDETWQVTAVRTMAVLTMARPNT
jgi:hypothetical protein